MIQRPPNRQDFERWMTDLGGILRLAESAHIQRHYPLALLRARTFPSIGLGQYRLLRRGGQPCLFLNWAWLNDSLSSRYEQNHFQLAPEDWIGGNNLWFMEIIGDHRHLPDMIHELRQVIPVGTLARWHQVDEIGSGNRKLRSAQLGPLQRDPGHFMKYDRG